MENGDAKRKKRQAERRPLLFEGFGSQQEYEDALCRFEQYLQLLARWNGKVDGKFGPPSLN